MPVKAFSASVVIHAIVFIIAAIVIRFTLQMPDSGPQYVQIATNTFEQPLKAEPVKEEPQEESSPAVENEPVQKTEPEEISSFLSFNDANADTNSLQNIYKESTLDVTIKYPAGWTYIDQNVKNKLDGVTFVASTGNYNPPPYVHLAVQDKYLFNQSRYKHKFDTGDYLVYYNEPEELAGQVSQIFYIRTDTDEDYSIKFIMKGEEAFKALQPLFFGMVKTFKFGDDWF
ncbi:MAG: hypothetical protein R6W90_10880 [Ignavibacteriaceae bacterium]